MTHLFIINPAAGSRDRTDSYRAKIKAACERRGLQYKIQISQAPGDCRRLARAAAETGKEYKIYACGGDGTLNEVADGAAGFPNVSVTVFSGGSGNDFVKIFDDYKAFFDLERLLDSEEVSFDLIRCNETKALNICSVGLDARIAADVNNYKRLPLLQGFRAYAASAVVNVVKGIAEHYVVEIDGKVLDGRFTFVTACSGRFYGGGFNPVPEADPTDGLLDVLLVKEVYRRQVPGLIGKYKNGRYKELSGLVEHFRVKSMKMTCDYEVPVNVDGEIILAKEVEFAIAEEKLRFFYPRGLSFAAKEPVKM
jgi:YegS/Rv2252/BmrU family lipid kinase